MKKLSICFTLLAIFWAVCSATAAESSNTIRGVVLDSQRNPITGATVLEKGTLNGTITDLDGTFTLDLSRQSGTLVVSFLGYKLKEVSVSIQNPNVTIVLEESYASKEERKEQEKN